MALAIICCPSIRGSDNITGAPPSFVHCFFFDRDNAQFGLLKHLFDSSINKPYVLFGNLRAGRTEETKERVINDMCSGVASILGISRDQIDMATRDIPAKWVMVSAKLSGGQNLLHKGL